MNNLINVPDYQPVKKRLRKRIYALMGNQRGERVVPYTERKNDGAIYRAPGDRKAADFPEQWLNIPAHLKKQADKPAKH